MNCESQILLFPTNNSRKYTFSLGEQPLDGDADDNDNDIGQFHIVFLCF